MQPVNVWMLPAALLMGLAWFLANTYPPWLSAWQETAALASAVVFSVAAWQLTYPRFGAPSITLSPPLAVLAVLVLISLALQLATGVMYFLGDAVMVTAYLLAWLLAAYAGHAVARTGLHNNLDVFWIVMLCSAIFSVGLATVQWLGIEGMNIFLLDMPAGGRPFANLGQPNNFCTLCFLGCASVLYFYERGMLRGAAFWLAWCWLSFGMALSQSRTGWLQIAWLVAFLWWMGRRIQLQVTPRTLMGLGAVFVTWVAALPFLSDGLLIATGRTLGEQMQGGVRLQYWSSMLHAIIQRPLLGYGWLQTGLAQQLDESSAIHGGIFDFAHNIVLDILLWAGLPLGMAIAGCFLIWLLHGIFRLNSGTSTVVILALTGILIHALLEYPLAYAYFLVPFGFLMGALHGLCWPGVGWIVERRIMAVIASAAAVFFLAISGDYFVAESAIRALRFESAKIGPQEESFVVPQLRLLTQLQALMRHGYRDPSENISSEEWEQMGMVSERFGLSFVMFRYALASAFRGKNLAAQETLERICRIHAESKCRHAYAQWKQWGEKYPLSVGMVPFPIYATKFQK